jgi:LPS export ABC transporter protein LptC
MKKMCLFRFNGWTMVLATLTILSACSFDYGQDVELSEIAKTTPDLSLTNARHSVIRDGSLLLTLKAGTLKVYSRENKRVFTELSFFQYDSDGKVVAEGTAGSATQAIDTESIDFSEGIEIVVHSENALIRADAISWDAKAKVFSSKADQEILIRRGTDTELRGTGLWLDASSRVVEFRGAVNGVLSD